MEKIVDKLVERIWYLTLNFGRDHKGAYVSSTAIIENNCLYNCSMAILVLDIPEKDFNNKNLRLETYVDDETTHIQIFKGSQLNPPESLFLNSYLISSSRLVFDYLRMDEMAPKLNKFEKGEWINSISREFNFKLRHPNQLELPLV
jgi:hypothetical protein